MKILLKRVARRDTYTIGKLYFDGVYQCDVLEDKDRGLKQGVPEVILKKMKVYGETAIPAGTYMVKWTLSAKFGKYLPEIIGVPAFSGIRIHGGRIPKHTLGCLLLGENKVVGQVINSAAVCDRVLPKIEAACKRGSVVITIE